MRRETQKTAQRADDTSVVPNTPIRFLFHTSKPHKWWALAAIFAAGIGQIIEIFEIWLISKLIDNFTLATEKSEQLDVLLYWGALFLVALVIGKVLWRVSGFTGIKWVVESNATAYRILYSYIINHSHTYFTDRFAGSLSNKISNAVDGNTRLAERSLWGAFPEIISLIAIIFLFYSVHPFVALFAFLVIVFVVLYNIWFVRKRRPHVIAYSAASSKFRGEGVDLLTNIAATRQYVQKKSELHRLDETIRDRVKKDLKQWFMGEWLMVTNTTVSFIMMFSVLAILYFLLQNNLATPGNVVLVLLLLARVSHIFNMVGNMMNGFVRMYGEVEEGLQTVLLPYQVTDNPEAKMLKIEKGEIVWDKVNFRFGDQGVFTDFDLKIEEGQRVGLVGPSGAGKTTFVSLLLRQHDIEGGTVTIDGQDISEVTQDSLRENIAVVPQEPLLFHRSIRENIMYGNLNATNEEVVAVAKKAEAHAFISALPEGYDTLVGERGIKLSGGQKQRVAIARAMLKDAPILMLDEATSALDSESEVAIQKALHKLMEGKTVIAIAHRLSTLREMDRILVLENGKIVEDGVHEELAKAGGTYERLWKHQAGGFLQE